MRRTREATERARRRREELYRRGIPPPPTPDELAPYPVEPWPRVRTFPQPPAVEVPRVAIPAPRAPAPRELPPVAPPNPVLKPPLPAPPRRQRTPPARRPRAPAAPTRPILQQSLPATLAAAAILRPILRRKTGEERLSFTAPRVAPPARIDNPIEERLQPALDLTPINTTRVGSQPLPFASATPQASRQRRREDECKCEESPEEEEENRERNRSNVVAQVKPYARRMSQRSLDNLRRG